METDSMKELKKAAINCLRQSFEGKARPEVHIVQAAVAILAMIAGHPASLGE